MAPKIQKFIAMGVKSTAQISLGKDQASDSSIAPAPATSVPEVTRQLLLTTIIDATINPDVSPKKAHGKERASVAPSEKCRPNVKGRYYPVSSTNHIHSLVPPPPRLDPPTMSLDHLREENIWAS